jgi:hypothetical protein
MPGAQRMLGVVERGTGNQCAPGMTRSRSTPDGLSWNVTSKNSASAPQMASGSVTDQRRNAS